MKTLLLSALFLNLSPAIALERNKIECQAYVSPENSYAVQLNLPDRFLTIRNEKGFTAQGNTSYAFSQAEKIHRYLLGISLTSSVQLVVESEGKERVALCLGKNECYPCI